MPSIEKIIQDTKGFSNRLGESVAGYAENFSDRNDDIVRKAEVVGESLATHLGGAALVAKKVGGMVFKNSTKFARAYPASSIVLAALVGVGIVTWVRRDKKASTL